ncbi:MAG: amidohydrolase family protein [Thermoleophilia bacterium]|nr:amidohydrolase family protein [Thermoleophilia bacterium]
MNRAHHAHADANANANANANAKQFDGDSQATLGIDVHQHLVPAPLQALLLERARAPRAAWGRRGIVLFAVGDNAGVELPAFERDLRDRIEALEANGIDLALIALSPALGVDQLTELDARALLVAYHEGALDLPQQFGAWAAVYGPDPDVPALRAHLAQGFAGVTLNARDFANRQALERIAPVIDAAAAADAPVFVHPGAAHPNNSNHDSWWPPVVDYVAQMQAAWFAWSAHGPAISPAARVLFAFGAGLAPLQHKRARLRGFDSGELPAASAFVETSSYGAAELALLRTVVGEDRVVYGTDRPYAPYRTPFAEHLDPSAARRATSQLFSSRTFNPPTKWSGTTHARYARTLTH